MVDPIDKALFEIHKQTSATAEARSKLADIRTRLWDFEDAYGPFADLVEDAERYATPIHGRSYSESQASRDRLAEIHSTLDEKLAFWNSCITPASASDDPSMLARERAVNGALSKMRDQCERAYRRIELLMERCKRDPAYGPQA